MRATYPICHSSRFRARSSSSIVWQERVPRTRAALIIKSSERGTVVSAITGRPLEPGLSQGPDPSRYDRCPGRDVASPGVPTHWPQLLVNTQCISPTALDGNRWSGSSAGDQRRIAAGRLRRAEGLTHQGEGSLVVARKRQRIGPLAKRLPQQRRGTGLPRNLTGLLVVFQRAGHVADAGPRSCSSQQSLHDCVRVLTAPRQYERRSRLTGSLFERAPDEGDASLRLDHVRQCPLVAEAFERPT